jgi:hypothetical protein
MKCAFEIVSVSMIYVPSLIKIVSGKLIGGNHRYTACWSLKPTFIFFNKESNLKMKFKYKTVHIFWLLS